MDGHVLSAESVPGSLILTLTNSVGAASSSSSDPRVSPALTFGAHGPSSHDPIPNHYLTGKTRAEVARVDWVRLSGTVSIPTIEHPAFPGVRFFMVEDTEKTFGEHAPGDVPERPLLRAFSADGTLLTDTQRIDDEYEDFMEEADHIRGVEDKIARIQSARVEQDDRSITLTIFSCGSEPHPSWEMDDDSIAITATVKLPYRAEDCLAGETVVSRIGLEVPVAGRALIDGRSGKPLSISDDQ